MRLRSDVVEFVKAAIQKPLEVSTIFPTSPALAQRLITDIPSSDGWVVELGPGTGAITRFLAPKLRDPKRYLGLEINEDMVQFLRRTFPQLHFEQSSADQIAELTGGQLVSAAVSSLPWTLFSRELQETTLRSIHAALSPNGVFVTYVCVNASVSPRARSFLKLLKSLFPEVERSPIEWRNIPPAFVYRATKAPALRS